MEINGINVSNQVADQDKLKMQSAVDTFNKTLLNGRVKTNELGKDDFLKLLVAELQHQDPTNPMQDRDFIAQMSQMSSLEQMNNISSGFLKLNSLINSMSASELLGKDVEINDGTSQIKGTVESVIKGEYPQVLVGGKYFDYSQVQKVTVNKNYQHTDSSVGVNNINEIKTDTNTVNNIEEQKSSDLATHGANFGDINVSNMGNDSIIRKNLVDKYK